MPVHSQSAARPRAAKHRLLGVLVLLGAGVFAAAAAPGHDMPSPGSRALGRALAVPGAGCGSDVWLVSTRRLPAICALPTAPDLHVERRVCGRWERSDLADLLGDDSRPLLIFIHGNRYDACDAKSQGVLLARHVAACCPDAPTPQTLIFSWPSDQQGILLKDGRAKYERAFVDAHYLAWLLGQVAPERPLAIVGYSFGALIASEAVEDLAAANRQGRTDIQPWSGRPGRTHLVFVAPAVRCDALAPRGPYREVLDGLEKFTLVINSRDDALRFFHLLDKGMRADALGYVGMPRRWLDAEIEYSATDAASIVGRNHGLPLYLASPLLTRRIAQGAVEGLADQ